MAVEKSVIRERLAELRRRMAERKIDVYLILTDDYHASEYVDAYFKCREYISGFTGSAGTLVVTQEEAGLWTDGRYYLQAEDQLADTGIVLQKMESAGMASITGYLRSTMKDGMCIGYDGRTVNAGLDRNLRKSLSRQNVRFEVNVDLVGEMWNERPPFPAGKIWELPESFTGDNRVNRLKKVRSCLSKWKADYLLLSSLDDIAWLYHIRGNDVLYNPVFMSYTLISHKQAILYVTLDAVDIELKRTLVADGVTLRPYHQIYEDLQHLERGKLWVNEDVVNVALMAAVPANIKIINRQNPTTSFKAKKTPREMENIRQAHIQDGVAVTKLLCWLKQIRDTEEFRRGEITEQTVVARMNSLRAERPGFLDLSFSPIIGSGAHGAIIHYGTTVDTDIPLVDNSFLLMDTGGQYWQGTTDITRTASIGEVTHEMKVHYTAVLRGNLNLAAARFAHGATGINLDCLARGPLWELGLDYNHGTGHGVGYLLNVHEGPQSIRMRTANGRIGYALEEGMLTSDEPGYYREGEYGIRLENLMLCVNNESTDYGRFLKFETVTMVPWDRASILPEMMSDRELELLNTYHREVFEKISPHLNEEERSWLAAETAPITR